MPEEKTVAPKIASTPHTNTASKADIPQTTSIPSIPTPPSPEGVNTEGEAVTLPESPKSDAPGIDVDTLIPSDPYYMDPLFYEVASFFGIEQEEYVRAKNYLSDIVEYTIREIKSNDPGEVLMKLREMEHSISAPLPGERRYKKVYQYVRLASKKQGIEKAMEAFQDPNNGN